jgi:regulatory protein
MLTPRQRATNTAYNLLAAQMRTEKQLADKLAEREFDEETIAEVLQDLRERGLVSDTDFAERWVESRGQSRGKRRLAQELRQKGVDSETISEALEENRDEEDETAACRSVAIKKAGLPPRDRSPEARQKLVGFLQRRGFGWDAIRPVLRELYNSDDEIIAED